MADRTLSCAQCGASFIQSGRGRNRATCPPCYAKVRGNKRTQQCVGCGRMSAPSESGKCSKCRTVVECVNCGGKAHTVSSRPDAQVTCRKCRAAAKRTAAPEARARRAASQKAYASRVIGSRDCEHCGTAFPLTNKGRKRNKRYCSHECDDLAELARRIVVTCPDCGEAVAVPPSRDGRQIRCAGCLEAWRNRSREPKPRAWKVYFPSCDQCGTVFCARSKRQRLCPSVQCKIDEAGARVNDLYRMATQWSSGEYAGAGWRQALMRYLVERDGDKCGICRKKVNILLKSGTKGSRKGPSIDHVVPRSKGGTDDPANLRLTHWGCNQKRGNRGGNEQLALMG